MSIEIVDTEEIIPEKIVNLPMQRSSNPLDMPIEEFQKGLDRRGENRKALMKWVKDALHEGTDFGSISIGGKMSKPSLWKPGAEKICGMLGLIVHFPTFADYEKAALTGVKLQDIIMRCEIRDPAGNVVADGIGARNVKEDKGDLNKALKMACKSAHIAATLSCAGLSEIFTQDLEDMGTSPTRAELIAGARDLYSKMPQERKTDATDTWMSQIETQTDDSIRSSIARMRKSA